MSYRQDYSPPKKGKKGTKYLWHSKALNYSPWRAEFWGCWPASISAWVDQREDDGVFLWRVEVRNFNHDRRVLKGEAPDGLSACLAAEQVGEAEKRLLWLPWMKKAIKAGWRPGTGPQ